MRNIRGAHISHKTHTVSYRAITHTVAVTIFALFVSACTHHILGAAPLKNGLECAIVQGGYSRKDYTLGERHPEFSGKITQKYLEHITEVCGARLVVLPESAFPVRQSAGSEIIEQLQHIARSRNEYIMTSMLLQEGEHTYNTAALFNPVGEMEDIYRKRTIVPFVETPQFTRGTQANTFLIDGHEIAPVICFESLFIRNYFRETKPELFIVMSNDIFAEKTVLPHLHQAYAVINARATGTPLLQVMQNGPSCYVDSRGMLLNLTAPYEQSIGLPVKVR